MLASRNVLFDFPHSQNRPILLEVGFNIPLVASFLRYLRNFKKAEWTAFAEVLINILDGFHQHITIRMSSPQPRNVYQGDIESSMNQGGVEEVRSFTRSFSQLVSPK